MLLNEMFHHILDESGEFLLTNEELEIKQPNFRRLVRGALGTYNKHAPHSVKFNVTVPASLKYTFTESSEFGIPEGVVDATPLVDSSVSSYTDVFTFGGRLNSFHSSYGDNRTKYLNDKSFYPFEYRKPDLYTSLSGRHDVRAIFNHRITKTTVNGNEVYEVKTIDEYNETFLQLLQARFLLSLSRTRRNFTIEEIPLRTDAEELRREAIEMERDAKESIVNSKKRFFDAF